RYRLLAILGEGPTGRVFKARNTYSNNTVAVKIIDTNDREWVSREGDALFAIKKEVRRVNSSAAYGSFGILEVLDVVPFLDTLWMVSPLCEGGNLKTMMQPLGCLKPVYIETTLRDVARALFWLHNQETFHGNVKAANVLIDERGGLRLCDFDLVSRGEISPSHSDCAYNGSLHWLAPERLEDRHNFHKRQDIWSFGALAYELATGSPPLSSLENESAILEHLATAGPPQLTGDQHCESLRKLIEYCLVIDIDQRPSMNLVFSHAYLSSTSEPASLRDLVETFHDWQSRQ
ncbi:kinase-like protein, partial [Sarocladium strictum]